MHTPPPSTSPAIGGALQPPLQDERGISVALREISQWRSEAEAQHQHQLDEVDEEVSRLKTALEDLQRQIAALADFRSELGDKTRQIEREHARRAHDGIFASLKTQADALDLRTRVAAQCEAGRQRLFAERLAASPLKAVADEYRQFKQTAAALASLPQSYREAILAHHRHHEEQLRQFAADHDPGPQAVTEAPLELDIVFTVDAAEGQPELVSIVLPVRESVYARWEDHADDLQLLLAARVIQGLYRCARALGLHRAHAMYGGHRGLLAVELELGKSTGDDIGARLAAAIDEAMASAPELIAARLSARAQRVPTDYLLPPEDGSSDEVEDDA